MCSCYDRCTPSSKACSTREPLLVQLYLIWLKPGRGHVKDFNSVSTMLLLLATCNLLLATCYLQNVNPRMKVVAFYVTMFQEKTFLVVVWLIGVHHQEPWYHELATVVMFLSFSIGIVFFVVYYGYFHVERPSYASYPANNNPPEPLFINRTYVTPSCTRIDSENANDRHMPQRRMPQPVQILEYL